MVYKTIYLCYYYVGDRMSKVNLIGCIFVLDEDDNNSIRRNNIKRIKLVFKKDNLISIKYDGENSIKTIIRDEITRCIGTDSFYLNQVYTLGEAKYNDNSIDVIYTAITNITNVNLAKNCYLVNYSINNSTILVDDKSYKYKTKEILSNNSEKIYNIEASDLDTEKRILCIMTCYDYIKTNINNSDILFSFLPKMFTLEDAHIVYSTILSKNVDKSNFRKRIIPCCIATKDIKTGKGFRPTKYYKLKNNIHNIII